MILNLHYIENQAPDGQTSFVLLLVHTVAVLVRVVHIVLAGQIFHQNDHAPVDVDFQYLILPFCILQDTFLSFFFPPFLRDIVGIGIAGSYNVAVLVQENVRVVFLTPLLNDVTVDLTHIVDSDHGHFRLGEALYH